MHDSSYYHARITSWTVWLAVLVSATAAPMVTTDADHDVVKDFTDVRCEDVGRSPGAGESHPSESDGSTSPLLFKAEARQVLVPVTVTDGSGQLVNDLGYEDFRLLEDGLEQRIDLFLNKETPLTLGLVVDVSGSMRTKLETTANAVSRLVRALRAQDRIFVIGFNSGVVLIQELTCEPMSAIDALARFEPGGGTAMFDGVVEGLYRLYKIGPGTRRALILLSDGFDNGSINTPHETVAAAKATGVPIYAVGLGKKPRGFFRKLLFDDPINVEFSGLDENRLRALSENTGGRAFILSDIERKKTGSADPVAEVFASLAQEIRSHYLLSYQPPQNDLDGRWHALRVDVRRPNLLVRFRPGYLALPLE